jgi:hypothetical protein
MATLNTGTRLLKMLVEDADFRRTKIPDESQRRSQHAGYSSEMISPIELQDAANRNAARAPRLTTTFPERIVRSGQRESRRALCVHIVYSATRYRP